MIYIHVINNKNISKQLKNKQEVAQTIIKYEYNGKKLKNLPDKFEIKSTNIWKIKKAIFSKYKISVCKQKLFYMGKELKNKDTSEKYSYIKLKIK
ncbi:hypothetical protein NUSPORA_01872 [Nucleospora cyclopteri]